MDALAPIGNYIAADPDLLVSREIMLDERLLNDPIVVAQRIKREYIKSCLKQPQILLPSTLIL